MKEGLQSKSAFVVRRCQILLSSAEERLTARQIAERLRCSDQTVRDVIYAFERAGLACLKEKSHARHDRQSAFDEAGLRRLAEIIRQSPRTFGHKSSLWTLGLLAQTCWSEGIAARPVSVDGVRGALKELGINWQRARRWIRSPDEHYEAKKSGAIG